MPLHAAENQSFIKRLTMLRGFLSLLFSLTVTHVRIPNVTRILDPYPSKESSGLYSISRTLEGNEQP